jgi:hypothetical protein
MASGCVARSIGFTSCVFSSQRDRLDGGREGDSETFFDHLQKAVGDCMNFLLGRAAQGALDDEESEAVNSRPGEILRPRPPFPWKDARLYHQVEGCREQLKWIESALARLCGINIALHPIGDGECCSEETRLRERKLQVPSAYCAHGRPCRFRGKFASPHAGDLCLNGQSERRERSRSDCLQEIAMAGKVPVSSIRSNSCPSCCFPEHDGIGAALPRQRDARFQQSSPQVPMAKSPASRRPLFSCRFHCVFVDSVHFL